MTKRRCCLRRGRPWHMHLTHARVLLQSEAIVMAVAAVVPHPLPGIAAAAAIMGIFMPVGGCASAPAMHGHAPACMCCVRRTPCPSALHTHAAVGQSRPAWSRFQGSPWLTDGVTGTRRRPWCSHAAVNHARLQIERRGGPSALATSAGLMGPWRTRQDRGPMDV